LLPRNGKIVSLIDNSASLEGQKVRLFSGSKYFMGKKGLNLTMSKLAG